MLLAILFALAVPAYGPPIPAPSGATSAAPASLLVPTAANQALIVDSGSTNRTGYRLLIDTTGAAALQQGDVALKKRVPAALVTRLFTDLRAAGALDQLPQARCMKSMSFGSSLTIGYKGVLSPDLSCPSPSSAARALAVDAGELATAAGVSMLPRGHAIPEVSP